MTQNDFMVKFSYFLKDNFKAELIKSDVESICDTILTDELMLSDLAKNYGNICLALYQYWKIGFNLDILKYSGISDKLHSAFMEEWSNIMNKKNEKINYDLLYLNDSMAGWATNFNAKECHVTNNIDTLVRKDRIILQSVNCDKLIIENWSSLDTGSSLFYQNCNIKELVFSDKIDLIKFRNLLPDKWNNIESVTYKGKHYNEEQFLDLLKQIKSENREQAKKINLYLIRKDRTNWYGDKKFYDYIFARKFKTSGKYRFALLSDMGGPGYSVAYFKSKEDAEKALNTCRLSSGHRCNIENARLSYLDISREFKEVETDYGINILIKKGSPGDR